MSRNDEYFRRYDGIYALVLSAHHDLQLLHTIDEIKPDRTSIGGSSLYVLSHICKLAKADLALSIWKILLDNDCKANSLRTLNAFLRNNFGKRPNIKMSLSCPATEKAICTIRKQVLAHSDFNCESVTILVEDMDRAIYEVKEKLNALCFPAIDDRVCRIEDSNLNVLAYHEKMGFGLLIESLEYFRQANEKDAL